MGLAKFTVLQKYKWTIMQKSQIIKNHIFWGKKSHLWETPDGCGSLLMVQCLVNKAATEMSSQEFVMGSYRSAFTKLPSRPPGCTEGPRWGGTAAQLLVCEPLRSQGGHGLAGHTGSPSRNTSTKDLIQMHGSEGFHRKKYKIKPGLKWSQV